MTGPDDILRAALKDVGSIDPTELAQRLAEAVRAQAADAAETAARPEEDQVLDQVLDRAAVVGVFLPADLLETFDHRPDSVDEVQLLSGLLRRSHPAPGQPGLRMLNVTERRKRLAALTEEGHLDRLFADVPLRPDDSLGRALRRHVQDSDAEAFADLSDASPAMAPDDPAAVSGAPPGDAVAPPPPVSAPRATMEALAQSAQVAAWTAPGETIDHIVTRTRIAQKMTEERVLQVASRFVGRRDLLDRIQAALTDSQARAQAASLGYPVIVTLHGIGGIGKSSLLTKLRERLSTRHPEMLFVRIDFDRPGFDNADLSFLTNEFTRQIACGTGDPDMISAVWNVRPERPPQSRLRKAAWVSSYESGSSSLDDALSSLSDRAAGTLPSDQPVTLLIDTFELRQAGGARHVDQIFEWLKALAAPAPSGLGLNRLLVLIAGRAPVDFSGPFAPPATTIEVDELSPDDARALLVMLGHSLDEAALLARVGGNPLLLHLVSRRVKSEGPLTRHRLAGLLATGAIDDPELRQGVLYDRVLGHVRDSELRRLSYPGLLLRIISPEIIRDVLAPVCLGRGIDDAEAMRLFKALRSEVWLVEETATDVVRHRSDVRRLMLPWMDRDPEVKERSTALHRAAAEVYHRLGFADEALFHGTMLAKPEELALLDTSEAQRVLAAARQDVDFLPAAVRATLWAITDDSRLDARDLRLLPPQLWDAATDKLGGVLIDRDDFRKALSVYDARPEGAGSTPRLWHRRAEDAVVQWDTLSARAYLDHTGPGTEDALLRVEQAGLTALRLRRSADALAVALAYCAEELPDSLVRTLPDPALRRLAGWNKTLDARGGLSFNLRLEDRVHVARTLVYGGVGLHHLGIPSQVGVARNMLVSTLRRQVWDRPHLAQTLEGVAQQLPLAEEVRKLAVLGLCSDERLLVSDAAIRPSRPWLDAVAHDLEKTSSDLVRSWATFCDNILTGTPGLAQLTGSLPQSATDILNNAVIRGHDLRGPLYSGASHPEFRAPLRSALTSETLGAGDGSGIAGRLSVVLDLLRGLCRETGTLWPARLGDDRGASLSAVEVERELARIILFADQAGLLARVIHGVADHWRDSKDLQEIALCHRYWQEAMDGHGQRAA